MQHGPWEFYHENGQLDSKVTYKSDDIDGSWVKYWDNGQLLEKGTDKNGKKISD